MKLKKRVMRVTFSGDERFPYSLVDDEDIVIRVAARPGELAAAAFDCFQADEVIHSYLEVKS